MEVDYLRLKQRLASIVEDLRTGEKLPARHRKIELRHIENLESESTNGDFSFRVDAAKDAGGGGAHARPMDYVLGGLASCQHMWCLRWAALNGKSFFNLEIGAAGYFSWRGEYLGEVDSGLIGIDSTYYIGSADIGVADALGMADMVAVRCPVFATLRKACRIDEDIILNECTIARRRWMSGETLAREL